MDCQLGYPENEPGSVPHLPPIRRPVVPETANVPTAKGVLNSNFRCGSTTDQTTNNQAPLNDPSKRKADVIQGLVALWVFTSLLSPLRKSSRSRNSASVINAVSAA